MTVAPGTVLTAYALGLIAVAWLGRSPSTALAVGGALGLVGGTLVAYAVALSRLPLQHLGRTSPLPFRDPAVPREQTAGVDAMALTLLRRIRFQRSLQAGRGMKTSLAATPVTAEFSATASRTSTEQPITLPDAVGELRAILGAAAGLTGKVLIGIDELDKIGTAEDAERFLNDIKAIFGIPGCYFLVSVSEDAVAAFERRGLPFRDVFDSSFDDVQRVDHLDLGGSDRLLGARTLEMSLPFRAMCHTLAGGLPRDVIRVARRMFDVSSAGPDRRVTAVCEAVVGAELRSKRDGTVTALAGLSSRADVGAPISWLADAPLTGQTSRLAVRLSELPDVVASVSVDDADQRAIERLLSEFAAYWYLCVTHADFFTNDRATGDFERAENSADEDGFEQLADARRALAIDPRLAWGRISVFRGAWGLPTIEYR